MRSMVQLADRRRILPSFLWIAFESGRGLTRPNANVSHTAAEIDANNGPLHVAFSAREPSLGRPEVT